MLIIHLLELTPVNCHLALNSSVLTLCMEKADLYRDIYIDCSTETIL